MFIKLENGEFINSDQIVRIQNCSNFDEKCNKMNEDEIKNIKKITLTDGHSEYVSKKVLEPILLIE